MTSRQTAPLWLRRVALTRFRNLRQAELATDARPVVLTGPNGAGKTNLLEAISLLTPGRGLRRAPLAELESREPANDASAVGWAVAAELVTPDGPRSLGTGSEPGVPGRSGGEAADKRLVRIDGERASSQQALGELLSVVWLTPQMDRLFLDGPSARRRFLDRLVYGFDPRHAGRLTAYEKALRERSRLLRAGSWDPVWVGALEDSLAERSVAIAAARRAAVERLAGACAQSLGAFPRAGLGLAGDAETRLGEAPAVEVESRLRETLERQREHDAETGGAGVGAHRADFSVSHLERRLPAALCSTGEQKALLISIVLAHARLIALEKGAAPLLLLDEVAAHLDEPRREALFEELLALGAQSWLTGTDTAPFAPLGAAAQHVLVQEGLLRTQG
ncbi:DNA replication and repair protein RecF [Tistlia consotensis]|nr:DNA replication and repair protein RecF [Tistlia consotensis]